MHEFGEISNLKLEGIIKKISYERRDYESVDEKKPILGYGSKNYEKKNSGIKGLSCEFPKVQVFLKKVKL